MMDEHDPLIERVAAELRRPIAFAPDFDARLMAAVRAAPKPGRLSLLWTRLREPRPVMVSPLGGLAMAAGFSLLVLGTAVVSSRTGAGAAPGSVAMLPVATTDSEAGAQEVQFVLVMPAAQQVSLVGDFNDWDTEAVELQQASQAGVWTVTVPLAPGRYRYTFVVDGTRWIADPGAPRGVDDDFGRPNSVITVGENGT